MICLHIGKVWHIMGVWTVTEHAEIPIWKEFTLFTIT